MHAHNTPSDIRQLNSFLRGELCAVETYSQAIKKLNDSAFGPDLVDCKSSHVRRVVLLRRYIKEQGGAPAVDSGLWGDFMQLVEAGATLLGDKAAVAAIERGEDHGRNDYRRGLGDLTPAAQTFVVGQLLPEQEHTHAVLSRMQELQVA